VLFAAGILKVFWIEGDTFSDFDFDIAQQDISSNLCDCYLRVWHKSILIALNLIITARGLQGCRDFSHQWLVDIDSPGGGLEIFVQFAVNLNSELLILSHWQRLDKLQIQGEFLALPVSMHLEIDLVLAGLPGKSFAILIERVFEIEISAGKLVLILILIFLIHQLIFKFKNNKFKRKN
jgi:hypothetical protein